MVNLTQYEIDYVKKALGRDPNEAEWKTIDALWSEHCSYKSSKIFLRSFPSEGKGVIMGIEDWQDAGAVDIGDNYAIVIKVESHNHPSAIDPFNGAATGVGGIIRDIISKGAKPLALLDMIRVGNLSDNKNKWLLKNIISGIGFYGNSIGVPVVGGELAFDNSYSDNPLVDIACVGIVNKNKIKPSIVNRKGLKIVIAGLTGIDGLGGASFASRKLSGEDEIGAVQIADPFAGKIIMDVTLEIQDKVEAIKDLGGGGLAVAVTEMSNGLGVVVSLDKVPLRVKDMRPEDILVSETQERMLYAVKDENVQDVCKAFEYYDYPCSVIGEITGDGVVRFTYNNKEIVSLSSDLLLYPPLYAWPIEEKKESNEVKPNIEIKTAIEKILLNPDLVSKEWAYSQFDYEVGTSTVLKPGMADSSVISLPNGKLLAIKGDANPDLCEEDAYECGKYIFAEAYKNLASVGSKGIVAVDHLQFGDPKRPEIYNDFVESVRGIGEAARFFSIPIVGGKVSFYNENKNNIPIKPTPLIVMAGLIEGKLLKPRIEEGNIVILGYTRNEMRGSLFSKIFGKYGNIPKSRLQEDLLASEITLNLINDDKIYFAKDVSRGGIIGSLMPILAYGYTVSIDTSKIIGTEDIYAKLFSENSGRFVFITSDPFSISDLAKKKGMIASTIGKVRKGNYLEIDSLKFNISHIIDHYYNYLRDEIE
ncbi:phosphoribosylformylglycinamidine synthase subunit PurL [Acidianus brierleyi]|uniref:phosphoribosylformylglycinamidine synthase subunit PurL n=1 Tax=Acidianus brierleyi TaxID=41673 RepID=UPI0014430112|nr:phosphoribosylformylglycinamidine synthase subunit PurL [Acidianus brierleyi]AWR94760.2 phosphoribosylformylglycinamidine synthase subunit PurL [Acidianus brierleyi]